MKSKLALREHARENENLELGTRTPTTSDLMVCYTPSVRASLLILASFAFSCLTTVFQAAGDKHHLRIRYGPGFESLYKSPRTVVSNVNNPVGLSFGTPGFNRTETGDVGRFLFIADGGAQVTDPLDPVNTAVDVRARILRVSLYSSDLRAGSNRIDGGENVPGSPEVSVVLSQAAFGEHIDKKLLGNNTISILGIVPVPESDDMIVLSSNSEAESARRMEWARRFSPTMAQLKGNFSTPIDWNSEFIQGARAPRNAKTGLFAGEGTRFFSQMLQRTNLMYYENGFALDSEQVYFDFGPEGNGLNSAGPGEISVCYPDAGMGLDVDPVSGDLFYAVHGERGEIDAARILRLSPDYQDPSSNPNARRTSRIDVVGATTQRKGPLPTHEFNLNGDLNGTPFTNIQSIRFGPDPRNNDADSVLYVVEFAGFQDTSFEAVRTSSLYYLEIDRDTNAATKILLAEGILNPVEMIVEKETGTIYLSLLGAVQTLSGRNLPPGLATGSVVALEPIFVNNPATYFVNGQGLSSTLILVNSSPAEEVTGTVRLRDSMGHPASVNINGSLANGELSFVVPPSGMRVFSTDGSGTLMIGSIQITSDRPVDRTVIIDSPSGSARLGAVPSWPRFRIPILSDSSKAVRTGITLSNPTPTPVRVALRLRDEDGTLLSAAEVSVSLSANGQISRFAEEFFPGLGIDFSLFRGTLEVDSPVPINGTAIRVSPGDFATLPPTRVD